MGRNVSIGGILVGLLCLVFGFAGAARAAGILWGASYDVAMKEAKTTGRPVMIDFYADWCGPCRQLDIDVYSAPEIIKAAEKFVPLKINIDTNPDGQKLGMRFQATSLPTIIFLSADGQILRRFSGYIPAPRFASEMNEALMVARDLPALRARYKSSPGDLEAAARLTAIYAKMNDEAAAKTALARVAKLDPDGAKNRRVPAMRALAEMYAGRKDMKSAVSLFREGVKYAHTPQDAATCRISAGYGSLMIDDVRGGVKDFLGALRDPLVPENDKKFARTVLEKIPTPLW